MFIYSLYIHIFFISLEFLNTYRSSSYIWKCDYIFFISRFSLSLFLWPTYIIISENLIILDML